MWNYDLLTFKNLNFLKGLSNFFYVVLFKFLSVYLHKN